MQTVIEQMSRHVDNFEETELSILIGSDRFPPTDVTARVVFIKILGWLKTRKSTRIKRPMRLPDFPWASKLRTVIERCEDFSNLFYIRGDELDFLSTFSSEETTAIEDYIDMKHNPIAMRRPIG
jgi:hypothetical protein